MIRVLCPRGHFIADVTVAGNVIPRGLRHGLSWDYAPDHNITRVRARCPRCKSTGHRLRGAVRRGGAGRCRATRPAPLSFLKMCTVSYTVR